MYAVVYQVDMKPGWNQGDRDAQLDQLMETVKALPGFVRGTWTTDGTSGLSFVLVDNEAVAKELASPLGRSA